ncbi:hypothetical protein JCM10213v2_008693 [Rhodosporidiobolus nylandii]
MLVRSLAPSLRPCLGGVRVCAPARAFAASSRSFSSSPSPSQQPRDPAPPTSSLPDQATLSASPVSESPPSTPSSSPSAPSSTPPPELANPYPTRLERVEAAAPTLEPEPVPEPAAPVSRVRRPVGAFRGGIIGFLLGVSLVGGYGYFQLLDDYAKASRELLGSVEELRGSTEQMATHLPRTPSLESTTTSLGETAAIQFANPKSRTDANANDRELYIAGLARSTKEADLRKLFEPFRAVKGVRVPTDDNGGCKGFAFVEYEEQSSAQAALSLNNHEVKKRHISVTIAQARATGTARAPAALPKKAETETRGIRVRGLAGGTEEAIIQLTFEKIAPVERVSFEVGSGEAVVMFEKAADVGLPLVQRSSLTVDGTPVEGPASRGRETGLADG